MNELSANERFSSSRMGKSSNRFNGGSEKIEVLENGIKVKDLTILNRDVADYFRSRPEEVREEELMQAIRVGIFCLERAAAGQNLDFVKRSVNELLNEVQKSVLKIPAETEKGLLEKIGTEDGKVLAPIQKLVNDVSRAANDKIDSIKTLLQEEIDPTKKNSTLSKAFSELNDMLDPNRNDSIQGSLNSAINRVSAVDGALAAAVKTVVQSTLKPLEEKVDGLSKEVRGKDAASEIIEQTTKKGAPYEEGVVSKLQAWAKGIGIEVHHVGDDNQPGDIVLQQDDILNEAAFKMVVECRDRQTSAGRKVITETLDNAMSTRECNCAVFVSKTRDGFAKEIGEWAEGNGEKGRWVACSNEHLISAIRFLMSLDKLDQIKSSKPTVDSTKIENQITRIRTTIDRVKNINTKVTKVRSSADEIKNEAEAIRDDVKSALNEIEDALRSVPESEN